MLFLVMWAMVGHVLASEERSGVRTSRVGLGDFEL